MNVLEVSILLVTGVVGCHTSLQSGVGASTGDRGDAFWRYHPHRHPTQWLRSLREASACSKHAETYTVRRLTSSTHCSSSRSRPMAMTWFMVTSFLECAVQLRCKEEASCAASSARIDFSDRSEKESKTVREKGPTKPVQA